MLISARSLPAVLTAALVVACSDGGGNEPRASWSEAFDVPSSVALFGVWGSGPDDVFIVGGNESRASIHHYDGAAWSEMSVPDVPPLIWVTGLGPDDVYAVGLAGSVLHYDGSDWAALDSGSEADLWGIFGFDSTEMWIVGGDPLRRDPYPTILRFDGQAFEPIVVEDAENSRGAGALFKVWGIDDALFAVGQRGQILQYRDGRWVDSPAGAQADQDFVSLWGTSGDRIVAVGGRSNARIATYDGERWSTRGESGLGGLNAVHMVSPGMAVIGGVAGFVGRYDVDADAIIEEQQDVTDLDIHAVWGDGEGRHYAVAAQFLPPGVVRGAALVRSVE